MCTCFTSLLLVGIALKVMTRCPSSVFKANKKWFKSIFTSQKFLIRLKFENCLKTKTVWVRTLSTHVRATFVECLFKRERCGTCQMFPFFFVRSAARSTPHCAERSKAKAEVALTVSSYCHCTVLCVMVCGGRGGVGTLLSTVAGAVR